MDFELLLSFLPVIFSLLTAFVNTVLPQIIQGVADFLSLFQQ